MAPRRFVVGIDLGTSNSAVAVADLESKTPTRLRDIAIPQLVQPGVVEALPLLPSHAYSPAEGEFTPKQLEGPFGASPWIVGEFARAHGARVPGRMISSAKSWLSHDGVDRKSAILPWGAAEGVTKISCVEAQALYLRHLRQATEARASGVDFADAEVVLTIPASFDEVARTLTLEAAAAAGFDMDHLVLLEEPLAAFYDVTRRGERNLKSTLKGLELLLVVDVGGGTTDFSLISHAPSEDGPVLRRIAVGEHLLLGGDNMDAALAHLAEQKSTPHKSFTPPEWRSAVAQCRSAKEALLGKKAARDFTIAITGGGSKLVGNTRSIRLTRAEVVDAMTTGFFPTIGANDTQEPARAHALQELGLPYASDPAITRHLLRFLRAHAGDAQKTRGEGGAAGAFLRPDAIVLNGGVFNADILAQALVKVVSSWWPGEEEIPLVEVDSLDLAVARGAAWAGYVKATSGRRIQSAAPRTYYIGVASSSGPRAVCVLPRGTEEGRAVSVKSPTFELTVGRPVQFQLYASNASRNERVGEVVAVDSDAFKALPPLHSIINGKPGEKHTVSLTATLTEVGTLSLACVEGAQRWRLEFNARGATAANEPPVVVEAMPEKFAAATLEVERVFGNKPLPVEPKDVKGLFRTLENILGPKETWRAPVLRELWTAVFAGAGRRRRSADHERLFFQLLGYSLRPGIGYPLDEWRCTETLKLYKEGVHFHKEGSNWSEFWIVWRRIAAGLPPEAQKTLFAARPLLDARLDGSSAAEVKTRGVVTRGHDELARTLAVMEHVEVAQKVELGDAICRLLEQPETRGGPWTWALGRLGARVPVGTAAHLVVPPEVAERWADVVLKNAARYDGAGFCVMLLCRRSGDRHRDVGDAARTRVLKFLKLQNASQAWVDAVQNVVTFAAEEQSKVLGDSLPLGLTIRGE